MDREQLAKWLLGAAAISTIIVPIGVDAILLSKGHMNYYIADMSGAVLMCEAANLAEMQGIAAQFPMAKAGVLKFEILLLKPYTGLESLFAKP